jgi:hypothetical protein
MIFAIGPIVRLDDDVRDRGVASLPAALSPDELRRRLCEQFYGDPAKEVFGGTQGEN